MDPTTPSQTPTPPSAPNPPSVSRSSILIGFKRIKFLLILAIVAIIIVPTVLYMVANRTQTHTQTTPSAISKPTVTPDPLASWKKYTGTGFSIQYPPGWEAHSGDTSVIFSDIQGGTANRITIFMDDIPQEIESQPSLKKENITVGTIPLIFDSYETSVTKQPAMRSIPNKDVGLPFSAINIYFGVYTLNPDLTIIKDILSTFKFTKQNENPACTQEAKLCTDGSYVARSGPNCEFAPCPTP